MHGWSTYGFQKMPETTETSRTRKKNLEPWEISRTRKKIEDLHLHINEGVLT